MREKSQYQLATDQTLKHHIFNMIYKVNSSRQLKKQTNVASYIISIVINIIIFLSSKQIKLIASGLNSFRIQVYITLFSIFCFTIFQFIICLIYKIQFYLTIQLKLSRFIIFPICINFLFGKLIQSNSNTSLYLSCSLVFMIFVLLLTILFQSQSFQDRYICKHQIPISAYFLIIQIIFYCIQIVTDQMAMLLSILMLVCSVLIKNNFFSDKTNQHIEHKILAINIFLYCVYAVVLFFQALGRGYNVNVVLCMITPIALYFIISQLVRRKTVPLNFTHIFNLDSLIFQEFAFYAQFLIEEAQQFSQTIHSNFCESLIFSFYVEHQKHCERVNCKIFADNWKDQFKNLSDPKTLKKLTQRVMKKLQVLFQQIHKNEPENIDLKLSFIKFYINSLPNKIRVFQLISEVQSMSKTLIRQYQIYQLTKLAERMDSIDVIDNLKTDEEVNQFQQIAYLTINSMMEFWLHFTEEKIDLYKVMNTSEKLLNYKKQMQIEWQKNKNEERYSTLKIVLLYSYYLRYVLHDELQANFLQFFSKALQEKLLHKRQIKYLSFGSEAALIGASLTDDTLGKIVIANKQASSVFNYSKNQISKIRLNDIMPKIFSEQHDHYLKEFHKNKYKRINSDERLLFGKDKFGYIIPILLQLQRTISSISQQLLFVANIRKFKVRQTPLICITDEEGQISDVSSGFKQLFYEKKEKDKQKIQIPIKNVQQIIPIFFQKNQPQDCGNYKFFQNFQSQKYGDFSVEFTVIPISFPLKSHGGFVVMGYRQVLYNAVYPLNYLNITKQIDFRKTKDDLQGNKVSYNPQKNRFQVDSFKSRLHSKGCTKDQIYTIPFININDMTNVFDMTKQTPNYGQKIRTVRLIQGKSLVRVQINDDFESEQFSQSEKVNRFEFKIKQLKYQYLHNKRNLIFIPIAKIIIILILSLFIGIWIFQFQFLADQTSLRQSLLKEFKFRYQVRGYLSEYILSFQGLQSDYNKSYFDNKTLTVREKLVNVIQESQIQQTKKQSMLKTVYLKDEADINALITSSTLTFQSLRMVDAKDITTFWIVYMTFLVLFLILQIVINYLHSEKIHGVYNVFLGVDEKMIKKSYDSCLKFSQMVQEKSGHDSKRSQKSQKTQDFDSQNQNPVSRMKKYKQTSNISLLKCLKYYLSFLIIISTCIIVLVQMKSDVSHFNKELQIFDSVYGLYPESSIALLNSYFNSYKKDHLSIDQKFRQTYQTMDQTVLQYQAEGYNSYDQSFFSTLMNDACLRYSNSLSIIDMPLCQTIEESIFKTGLGKVTNFLAKSIQNLKKNTQTSNDVDEQFFNLFQLQYDFYVPMVTALSGQIHTSMLNQVSEFQNKYKIWMGIITLIVTLNAFYIYHFLLQEIKDQIELCKELLYFIPDSFIEQKTTKFAKRKPRQSRSASNDDAENSEN